MLNGKKSFLKFEPWKLGPSIYYVSKQISGIYDPLPLCENFINTVLTYSSQKMAFFNP